MPYAITQDGFFRAVTPEMELTAGEELFEDIPQWVWDLQEVRRLGTVEDAWRVSESLVISTQLMALEEDEAGVEVPDLLPGTRTQWLSYRSSVRAWKDGNPDFPNSLLRPSRP